MERSDRIAVVPLALDWSDVGSWAAIYELADKDSSGNAVDEGSWALGSRGCLVRSTGPSVVAVGVEDLVVIATPDHVLIVPRSEAQRVREAAELAKRG
jgi:mannose-1-phosphate guanylyltransferase